MPTEKIQLGTRVESNATVEYMMIIRSEYWIATVAVKNMAEKMQKGKRTLLDTIDDALLPIRIGNL